MNIKRKSPVRDNSEDLFVSVEALRNRITSRLIPLLLVALLINLFLSLTRIPSMGFRPFMWLHILIACIVTVLFTARKHIRPQMSALVLTGIISSLLVSGVATLGLLSASLVLGPIMSLYLMLLGYRKSAYASIAIMAVYFSLMAVFFVSGTFNPPISPALYVRSPIAWLLMIVAVCGVAFAFVGPFELVPGVLARSEERFRTLFENATIGIYRATPEGNIVLANPALIRMLGYDSFADLSQRNLEQERYVPQDHRSEFHTRIEKDGEIIGLESSWTRKDGSMIVVRESATISHDTSGTVLYYEGTVEDITERKRAEEELLKSKLQHEHLVANIPSGVYIVRSTPKGSLSFDFFSTRLAHMLDLSEKAVMENPEVAFHAIHPDELSAFLELQDRHVHQRIPFVWEGRVLAYGKTRWMNIASSPEQLENGDVLWHGTVTDVTEHKTTIEQLEMLKHSIDRHYDGAFWIDSENKFVYVNDAACKSLGYQREELESMQISAVDANATDDVMAGVWEVLRSKKFFTAESTHRRKDGTEFPVEIVSSYVKFGDKEYNCGFARDITVRRKAEVALHESESKYRDLVEHSPDAIAIYVEGKIVFANSPSAQLMRASGVEELIGRPVMDLVHPDYRELVFNRMKQAGTSGKPLPPLEEKFMRFDGSAVDVEVKALPMTFEGRPAVQIIVRDITERKQAQEALQNKERYQRALLDNFPFAVWLKDTDSRFLAVNEAFAKTFNVSSADALTGKNDFDIMPDQIAEEYRAHDRMVLESKEKSIAEQEVAGLGEHKWFETYKAPVIGKQDELLGTVGFLRDITDRKAAETERRHTEQALRQSEERFSKAFNATGVLMSITSLEDGRYLDVNDAFCRTFGYTRQELIGKAAFSQNIIIDKVARDAFLTLVKEQGQARDIELTVTARSGEVRVGLFSAVTVSIGEEVCLLTSMVDITERKRAEEELKSSEERFRMIFDNVIDGISIFREDPDPAKRRLVDCNERYATLAGRSKEELLRRGSMEGLCKPWGDGGSAAHLESLSEGTEFRGSFSWVRPDGKENVIEYIGVPILWHGERHAIGIDRDVTERKRAEEALMRYQLLSQNTRDIILFVRSGDGCIVEANDAAVAAYGYDRQTLLTKSIRDLRSNETQALLESQLEIATSEGLLFETVHRRADGSTFPVEVSSRGINVGIDHILLSIIRDTTERKRAHEAVERERTLLRTLINSLPDSVYIYIKDRTSCYLLNNVSHLRSLGAVRQEDVLGKSPFDFFAKEEAQRYVDDDQGVMQSGTSIVEKEELVTDRSFGEKRWHLTSKVPLRDADGNVLGLVGMTSDITDWKLMDQKLRESESRYRQLVETMPDGVYRSTHEGKFLEVNSALVNILGYESKEDLLSVNIKSDLYFAPEDRDRIALEEKIENTAVYRLKRKDGTEIWVEDHGRYVVNEHGTILYHEGVLRDVSERIRMEEELRQQKVFFEQMFTQSSVSTQILDRDGWCERINPKLSEIFGVQPEHMEGKVYNIFNDRGIKEGGVLPHLEKVFREGKSAQWEVFFDIGTAADSQNIPVRDKKKVWFQNWAYPIFDDQHRLSHVIIQHIDVTDRKQAEEALRHAQKLESIGTLAGGIAHDFNNLLNAMLGQSTLAIGKLPNESPAKNHIEKSIKAAERAADLTRQMLAYSGKGKLFTEEIDLNRLVTENVQMLEVSVPKTTQLRYELGSPSPTIRGDIGQIQQVIMNLIINAGEAMGPNPGYITVRTSRIHVMQREAEFWKFTNVPLEPGAYASLEVVDTGHGMRPEVLERIFDPFFSTKFTGRGLGLAAVLGIIRSHQGGIRIESEEGKGTRFEIVFPLISPARETDTAAVKTEEKMRGEGLTILVIDDEASVVELLTDILGYEGFKIQGALNPVEGIAMYRQRYATIDMVILDYSMPGMDGKAAFDELVKINKDVKVLLCSGYSEEEMESAFDGARPAGILQKPYSTNTFLEMVAGILHRNEKE